MAKQLKEEINEPELEADAENDSADEVEAQKSKIKKKIVKAGVAPNKAENIIGEIETPENDASKDDIKAYFDALNKKIDDFLAEFKSSKNEELDDDETDSAEPVRKKRKPREQQHSRRDHFGIEY